MLDASPVAWKHAGTGSSMQVTLVRGSRRRCESTDVFVEHGARHPVYGMPAGARGGAPSAARRWGAGRDRAVQRPAPLHPRLAAGRIRTSPNADAGLPPPRRGARPAPAPRRDRRARPGDLLADGAAPAAHRAAPPHHRPRGGDGVLRRAHARALDRRRRLRAGALPHGDRGERGQPGRERDDRRRAGADGAGPGRQRDHAVRARAARPAARRRRARRPARRLVAGQPPVRLHRPRAGCRLRRARPPPDRGAPAARAGLRAGVGAAGGDHRRGDGRRPARPRRVPRRSTG